MTIYLLFHILIFCKNRWANGRYTGIKKIIHKESNMSKKDEITEVIKDTVIQGIVELNHNGYIY